jgi:hypothetical protein
MEINAPQRQKGVRGGISIFTRRIGALAGNEQFESRLFGSAVS